MASSQFWNSWSQTNRRIFLILGGLFLLTVVAAMISYAAQPWPVFSWQQLQELQAQELPVYSFERGSLEFTIPTDNYILFERWVGNSIKPNLIALDIYFFFFACSLIVLLSIISILPRFWFYVGSGIIAFLISSFRWETLLLGGLGNKVPVIGILILSLGVLVYFHFLQTTATFLTRITLFSIATITVTVIIVSTSGVNQPLRMLAANTLPAATAMAVLFIIVVAHQPMASFVTLANKSSSTHSLRQYLVISIIYLLNLWLAYWDRIAWMDWDYTVPGLVLLVFSGILTVWNIRQREVLYEGFIQSEVYITYFILAFGMMAFATVGYFLSSSNDIVILSISDIIIYTHLGYGMMFLLYVGSNFVGAFEKNLPVQKILYKPTAMPYFTYRFAGLIVTLAFVFYNTWTTPVNQFISGYYTTLGDLHFNEPSIKAFNFYRRGHAQASYNQHASTALAELEGANGHYQKQIDYSVDANRYKPTEITLLNTDNLYLQSGNAYQDVQLLRRGKALLPSSGLIKNNLGLAFTRIGRVDSALFYFERAGKDPRTKKTATLNLLGLIGKNNLNYRADSVNLLYNSDGAAVRSNALAIANRQGQVMEIKITIPADSILDLFTASLLSNYLTNQITQADTSFISACIQIANKNQNQSFRPMIHQSAARACYATGQVNRAFSLLQKAITSGNSQGTNSYVLGLWAMDQQKHNVALTHFYYALTYKSAAAALANAVALAEEGRMNEAIIAWDSISHRQDTTLKAMGESMKRILAAPASWFSDLTEREKLYYALYRIPLRDTLVFDKLVHQISNEDLRAKAFLNRSREYYDLDEMRQATQQFKRLKGLHLTDSRLFVDIKYFELRLLAAQRRVTELQAIVDQGILFGPYRAFDRVYYDALQQEAAGDTSSAAKSYLWLANNNWYFDEGVIGAARFFNRDKKKSYAILSEALQVNPHSVKILKAYIPVALSNGFEPYALGALETLQGIISPESFNRYVTEKQLTSLLLQ